MIIEPLEGKARAALDHQASIIALEGSVRSGKTWASLIDWLDQSVRRGPEGDLVIVGKTRDTIVRNIIYPLQSWLGSTRVVLVRGIGEAYILGRRVMLIGANNEGAVDRIQGATFAGAYVDEASTLPENFFDMLYSRLSVAGSQLWLTSNPETPGHWLKTEWLDKARLWVDRDGHRHVDKHGIDLVRLSFKLEDNPNLPPAFVEQIKAAYSGLWYRRYILGEWCIAAGAVYDCWDPAVHVRRAADVPSLRRLLALAIDYGTTNPTRGLLLGLTDEARPHLVVVDEWAPPLKQTDATYSRSLRAWLKEREGEWGEPEWIVVDPSAASFKRQLFEDGLTNVMDAQNAVLPGIRIVSALLSTGMLEIADACAELIAEIPGYSWDPAATAKGEDAPIKAADHSCDALRYAVLTTRSLWGLYVSTTMDRAEVAA